MPTAILGMLRSGTSMVARLVNLSGLYIGSDKDVYWAGDANPAGFWEPRWLIDLNDRLLATLGGTWDDPPRLDAGWRSEPGIDALFDEATMGVASAYGNAAEWGWKSPTTTACIPFWREVVPDLRFIICVRNPLDVAASARRVWNLTEPHAVALWQMYTQTALRETKPHERVVVMYDDFFTEPARALEPVLSLLGLPPLESGSDRFERVKAHIDRQLKHFSSANEVEASTMLSAKAKALYAALVENHGYTDPDPAVSPLLSDSEHLDDLRQTIRSASRKYNAWKRYELEQRELEILQLKSACADLSSEVAGLKAEIGRLKATFQCPPYNYLVRASALFKRAGPIYSIARNMVQKRREAKTAENAKPLQLPSQVGE